MTTTMTTMTMMSKLGSAGKRFFATRPVAKSLLPDPTRTRGLITRSDPNPRVRVGLGKPAGTHGCKYLNVYHF